ncbi:MAG: T9SS type A sorting domain-containing protein [Bacteroidota bacterium]
MVHSGSNAGINTESSLAVLFLAGVLLFTAAFIQPLQAQTTARAVLSCTVETPTITADNKSVSYAPMPFPVTLTVRNTGGARSDSVFATIILPPDLSLAEGTDSSTKHLKYPQLFPQQSSTVQWMVKHPPSTVERRYVIQIWVRAANADSSLCEAEVIIPLLAWPILSPRDYVPDSLHFDEAADSYIPNPFTVRLTCVNNGNASAFNVTGTIKLPANVAFDPPDQPATKSFYPAEMIHWNLGDPVPEVTWTVRWVPRLRWDAQPEFSSKVTGLTSDGIRLDSTEVRAQTTVPGLMPFFDCDLVIPDSLALNAAETNVEPNPFIVKYIVTNRSKQVGRITRIYINFPAQGITLSSGSGNPINQSLNLTLDKDESHTFTWVLDVADWITRRNVLIQVTAIDDEGSAIQCEHWLPIANLKTALSDSCLRSSAKVLRYVSSQSGYDPQQFVISGKLRNTGGANLNSVIAQLEWTDGSGVDLIEFDPAYPGDNTNPKVRSVLFPGQSVDFEWGFRLKNNNTTGVTQIMAFNLWFGSKETPFHSGCEVGVEIEPAGTTGTRTIPAPKSAQLHPVHPNPFTSSTIISYTLPHAAPITMQVIDALGREVRRLRSGDFTEAGTHCIRFDAIGLPPGLYLIRLVAGEHFDIEPVMLQR